MIIVNRANGLRVLECSLAAHLDRQLRCLNLIHCLTERAQQEGCHSHAPPWNAKICKAKTQKLASEFQENWNLSFRDSRFNKFGSEVQEIEI